MDPHFHYNVIPKTTTAGVTTRIVFQDELTPAEIYAAAATESGLTAAQVEAATTAAFRQIIIGARRGQRARRVGSYFSFTPRCGGGFPTADFEPTVENMNLAINAALSPDGDSLFVDGLTFQRDGILGQKLPEILRVYDALTRTLDAFTPGNPFKISGHDFGPEPALGNTTCGLFLQTVGTTNPPTRIPAYSDWTPSEITGAWPASLSGDQRLTITTSYEGSTDLRTFIWPTILSITT